MSPKSSDKLALRERNAPPNGHLRAVHELPGAPTVSDAFAGKHLMITGVTGFLGKVWLAMLLDRVPTIRRITVVARGQKRKSAQERVKQIYESSPAFRPLREKHGVGLHALFAEKVRVVDAKLSEPLCGFSEAEAKRLMADVDVVVHFAGLTDFEPDPVLAIDANILGAQHVADLAALSPKKRYVHCSTCFVAGMVQGDVHERVTPGLSPNGTRFTPHDELLALLAEMAELPSKKERVDAAMERARRLGWPNIYTYTKALAEHLLEQREDLAQTTVRPAIVECAREYPFVGWNEGVNTSGPIVWLLSTSFRRFPAKAKNVFDVVPVDTVARAMTLVTAASLRGEAKSVYHVASGHQNPLTFERALDLNALAYRKRFGSEKAFYEREVLSRLDSFCVDPDRKTAFGGEEMRRLAQELRNFLRGIEVKKNLPPRIYEKHGEDLEEKLRSWSMKCRTTDRKLGTIEEMLRQYRPFIHDHDYCFHTTHLAEATAALTPEDQALFGFDIGTLDWRHYWMEVQVPGLEQWSIPILRGEKVPEDPPLAPAPEERDGTPTSSILVVA